jgi:hypothetical protein
VDCRPLNPIVNASVVQQQAATSETSTKKEDGMGSPVTFKMRSSRNSKPNLGYCVRVASFSAIATILLFMKMGLDAEPSSVRQAILSGISYDQADRSVSIMLHLNDHRPFTLGRLDSGLYVDIENTRLSTALVANGAQWPGDRPVQVKTQQLRKDTARVIFEFDAISRLQAVQLKDASGILVEIDLPEQPTETGDALSASATSFTTNRK